MDTPVVVAGITALGSVISAWIASRGKREGVAATGSRGRATTALLWTLAALLLAAAVGAVVFASVKREHQFSLRHHKDGKKSLTLGSSWKQCTEQTPTVHKYGRFDCTLTRASNGEWILTTMIRDDQADVSCAATCWK